MIAAAARRVEKSQELQQQQNHQQTPTLQRIRDGDLSPQQTPVLTPRTALALTPTVALSADELRQIKELANQPPSPCNSSPSSSGGSPTKTFNFNLPSAGAPGGKMGGTEGWLAGQSDGWHGKGGETDGGNSGGKGGGIGGGKSGDNGGGKGKGGGGFGDHSDNSANSATATEQGQEEGGASDTFEVTLDRSGGLGLVLVDNDNLELEQYQTVVNGFQLLKEGEVTIKNPACTSLLAPQSLHLNPCISLPVFRSVPPSAAA
jgi:hypothetical protein